jgi:hypothetical protein
MPEKRSLRPGQPLGFRGVEDIGYCLGKRRKTDRLADEGRDAEIFAGLTIGGIVRGTDDDDGHGRQLRTPANLPQQLDAIERWQVKVEKNGDQFIAMAFALQKIPRFLAVSDDAHVAVEVRLAQLAEKQLAVVLAVLDDQDAGFLAVLGSGDVAVAPQIQVVRRCVLSSWRNPGP